MANPPSTPARPEFRLTRFVRRDAGGNRVTAGRPFGVELAIRDRATLGGPCAVSLSAAAPCSVTPARLDVAVAPDGTTKRRLDLVVRGPSGATAIITATLDDGREKTLVLMLRGHGA